MFPITSRISHLQRIFCCTTVCYNQTACKGYSSMLVKTLRGADLLFGARFFSYWNIESFFCKVNHCVVGMGT